MHYALHSALLTVKNISFVVFAVVLPVVLYLVFSQIFGDVDAGPGIDYAAVDHGLDGRVRLARARP